MSGETWFYKLTWKNRYYKFSGFRAGKSVDSTLKPIQTDGRGRPGLKIRVGYFLFLELAVLGENLPDLFALAYNHQHKIFFRK